MQTVGAVAPRILMQALTLHGEAISVDLADVYTSGDDADQLGLEGMRLPVSNVGGSPLVYQRPDSPSATPIFLDKGELDAWTSCVTSSFSSLLWGAYGVIDDISLAVHLDHQDSSERTVFMQAIGLDLVLIGRLSLHVDDIGHVGKAAGVLLHEQQITTTQLYRALSTGLDTQKAYGVTVMEIPAIQWEHTDTGEPVGPPLPALFCDPLIMLAWLARHL